MITRDEARKSRALNRKASRIAEKIRGLKKEQDTIYGELIVLEKKCEVHKFNKNYTCKICGGLYWE
jgi:ribosomal protein L22